MWSVAFFMNGEMYMLFEQVYVLFIYILIGKLAMVTVVAIALFVALVDYNKKIRQQKKHISVWS